MPNMTSPKQQWIGFILGFFVISWATLTPIEQLPAIPPGGDKLHHILGFGGWALMCAFGPMKPFTHIALLIIFWGGLIELIQPNINRYSEWLDFYANTFGVLLVFLIKFVMTRVLASK